MRVRCLGCGQVYRIPRPYVADACPRCGAYVYERFPAGRAGAARSGGAAGGGRGQLRVIPGAAGPAGGAETHRRRLDRALVERGLYPSRERAQQAVRAGLVTVNGRVVTRPAEPVEAEDRIEVHGDPVGHVGRGALKLIAALDHWRVDPAGLVCLDVGASTGGFTEVLLRRGAARVYAVDVGHGQLHPRLRADPRVVVMEGTDVRALAALPGPPPALVTVDVSFISLTLVLPHLLRLAPGAPVVALVKPQFEVGRGRVGKGGVVRDEATRRAALARVLAAAAALGYRPEAPIPSPVPGGDGNVEFLALFRPPEQTDRAPAPIDHEL